MPVSGPFPHVYPHLPPHFQQRRSEERTQNGAFSCFRCTFPFKHMARPFRFCRHHPNTKNMPFPARSSCLAFLEHRNMPKTGTFRCSVSCLPHSPMKAGRFTSKTACFHCLISFLLLSPTHHCLEHEKCPMHISRLQCIS